MCNNQQINNYKANVRNCRNRRKAIQGSSDEGSEVSFDTVMLKDNDGNVEVGQPYIAGANVKATVLKHLKGDKVLVFKKIRRKGYQKMNGHRDYLTQIKIDSIN